ncbi:hypothetical protein O1L44_24850 [Streptomyces noursei]|nr:hypothetical protein [Streptomyces noursei]
MRQLLVRARPLLIFVVLVLIVVVASALLGWRDDTFGAGHREGGAGGGTGQSEITVSCEPRCGGREGPAGRRVSARRATAFAPHPHPHAPAPVRAPGPRVLRRPSPRSGWRCR